MNKYFKHFWVISKHKWYVMIECWKRGLYWQGLVHDLSKYSFTEFCASAKYFQGDCSPICKEKAEKGYSKAWLHHKAKNKHHWEYWIDFKDGEVIICPMPLKYITEMACDMIGASKAYLKGKYNKSEPLEYFEKDYNSRLMRQEDKNMLKDILLIHKYEPQNNIT